MFERLSKMVRVVSTGCFFNQNLVEFKHVLVSNSFWGVRGPCVIMVRRANEFLFSQCEEFMSRDERRCRRCRRMAM